MGVQLDETEKRIVDLIEANRDEIIAFARDMYTHAELGYKEFKTAEKFTRLMKKLNLPVKEHLAVTGVKAYLNEEKKDNVSLALIGELDALRIPEHKYANPETQAAHCCGHHAQMAGVIGAAFALTDSKVKETLDGQVVFFAVPAEEYGEIEFKNQLTKEGKIRYKGVAAHAAGAPYKGINALNAASLGLSALAYQRETFKDEDHVRVHPIITKGGNLVNVVPDEVVIETLVRASNKDAIADAAFKTDRAFKAGAAAIGATCQITTAPGYLPTLKTPADEDVLAAAKIAAATSEKEYTVVEKDITHHSGGSTDVGDVQHIQPVLTFNTGGKVNGLHTVDFDIVDEELAYIVTAKIFALSAYRLLRNGAIKAKEIVKNYHPVFTKEEYIQYMDSFLTYEEQKN